MSSLFADKRIYLFLVLGIISIIAALIVTIPENPPGLILSYLASLFFVLAFTYNLKSTKSYLLLLIVSVIVFVVSAILHNLFHFIGEGNILEGIGAIFFLVAIFLCPAGITIGLIGSIVKSITSTRNKSRNLAEK